MITPLEAALVKLTSVLATTELNPVSNLLSSIQKKKKTFLGKNKKMKELSKEFIKKNQESQKKIDKESFETSENSLKKLIAGGKRKTTVLLVADSPKKRTKRKPK